METHYCGLKGASAPELWLQATSELPIPRADWLANLSPLAITEITCMVWINEFGGAGDRLRRKVRVPSRGETNDCMICNFCNISSGSKCYCTTVLVVTNTHDTRFSCVGWGQNCVSDKGEWNIVFFRVKKRRPTIVFEILSNIPGTQIIKDVIGVSQKLVQILYCNPKFSDLIYERCASGTYVLFYSARGA